MRTSSRFRGRALGAAATALVLGLVACAPGGGTAVPTAVPAAKPTEAPKPAAASPAASPAAVTSPVAAKPASSPVASPGAAKPSGDKPPVRIGSTNFGEQILLGELYGQILEANGYRVERRFNLGNREIVYPAFESGQIDMYPEYLATLLAFVTKSTDKASDPAAAHRQLLEAFRGKGLSVLDYAQAVDTNAFVVLKETAEKHKLTKMSDLTPVASQLVLGAPPECPQRPFCLPGLEKTYNLKFKDFKPLDAGGPLTVAALEGKQIDVALLFSTDAVISAKGFVLLQDDKGLQAADNVAPVVREDLLNRAPSDFRQLINGVSAKLTTANLTDMNKQVGLDRKEPKDVAAAFLRAEGLLR